MSEYTGTMTELRRDETDGAICVVVSYWTNDKGETYEPRVRFVVGEKDRPVKGLTKAQALSVRDAFNSVCEEWSTAPAKEVKRKSKKPAKKKAAAAESKSAAEAAAADAIADMFKSA